MATLAVTNTFTANTDALAADVNTNFSDIVNYVNNRNSGSATWDVVSVLNASSIPLIVDNSSGSVNIANFRDNGTNVFTIANGGVHTITTVSSASGGPALTINEEDTVNALVINANNASFANDCIKVNTSIGGASTFNLLNLLTNSTARFKVTGAGVCTITTVSSSSGGPALTITEADTVNALYVNPTNGSYANSAIKVDTTRAGNTAFNLLDLKANATSMLTVDGIGNVVLGSAAIATTATDGFLYITSCAGAPTGTPTSFAGRVPMVYDSTNDKFYVYRGGWKSVTLS